MRTAHVDVSAHSPHCLEIWSTFGWRWRPFSWQVWGPAWCCDTWCFVPTQSTGRIPTRSRSLSRCRTPRHPFVDRSYRSAGPDVPDSCAGIRSQARHCRRRRRSTISTSPDHTRLSASLFREFTIYGEPVNCNRLLRSNNRRHSIWDRHRLRWSLSFWRSLPTERGILTRIKWSEVIVIIYIMLRHREHECGLIGL